MKSIIFSGFGGQGIQFCSRQLALAGMYANKKVTWMPAYGAESRGGTSNCTVIIADDGEIGSPVVRNPDIAFVMSAPAYKKFVDRLAPGGVAIVDNSPGMLSDADRLGRKDITEHNIPATQLAYDNGLQGLANLIMVGKLLKVTGVFTTDEVADALRKSGSEESKRGEDRSGLIEKNIKALNIGYAHG